jgi:hypothetical protein
MEIIKRTFDQLQAAISIEEVKLYLKILVLIEKINLMKRNILRLNSKYPKKKSSS